MERYKTAADLPEDPGRAEGAGKDDAGRAAESRHELAAEALSLAKLRILTQHRALFRAVQCLIPAEGPALHDAVFQTDGKYLYYDAKSLPACFAEDPSAVSRELLHTLLHCLLGHVYRQAGEPDLWDLACDITVEGILMSGPAGQHKAARQHKEARQEKAAGMVRAARRDANRQSGQKLLERLEYERLTQAAGGTSASALCRYLTELRERKEETEALRELFCRDSHALWYGRDKAQAAGGRTGNRAERRDGEDADSLKGKNAAIEDNAAEEEDAAEGTGAEETGNGQEESRQPGEKQQEEKQQEGQPRFWDRDPGREAEEWEQLRREIKEKDQIQRNRSAAAGRGREKIRVHESRMDYREFLEQFGNWEETIAVSQEEFDLIFYEYGLRCYGNIPLIEPLEYRDDHKIREFVIAIDTSGSVLGEQIRDFISQTFAVLRQPDFFSGTSRIHVIQCDAKIQEVTVIEGQGGLYDRRENVEIRGLGGTDFVPVFDYIAGERAAGRMECPQGLIYFTDGLGTYPETGPDYPTAFLMKKQAYRLPEVPDWAVRAVMDGGQIVVE